MAIIVYMLRYYVIITLPLSCHECRDGLHSLLPSHTHSLSHTLPPTHSLPHSTPCRRQGDGNVSVHISECPGRCCLTLRNGGLINAGVAALGGKEGGKEDRKDAIIPAIVIIATGVSEIRSRPEEQRVTIVFVMRRRGCQLASFASSFLSLIKKLQRISLHTQMNKC